MQNKSDESAICRRHAPSAPPYASHRCSPSCSSSLSSSLSASRWTCPGAPGGVDQAHNRAAPRVRADAVTRPIAQIVARHFSVGLSDVYAKDRGCAQVALARQAAIYIAHVVLRLTYVDAGAAFDRDRTTASHACRRIEDRRDDAAFDARMAMIERECMAALAISVAAHGQELPAGTIHAGLEVRA